MWYLELSWTFSHNTHVSANVISSTKYKRIQWHYLKQCIMYCVPVVFELRRELTAWSLGVGEKWKKLHLISLLQNTVECSWNLVTMVIRGLGYRKGI